MYAFTRRLLAALVFLAAALPFAARADDLSATDEQAMRGMVNSQIDAFRHDDGNAAYGLASPTIHSLFPTADQFMAMVRNSYQPVYRPQSVTFGSISQSPYGPMAKVFVVGPDGRSWVALYTFQHQPDGTWKINGCTLIQDDGATI